MIATTTPHRAHRRATGRLAALGLTLAVLALPAAAQPSADDAIRGLTLVGSFQVVLDGKVSPKAEVFQTNQPPSLLIMTSELPAPVLIRGQWVESVHIMKIARRGEVIDLLSGATLERLGPYQILPGGEGVGFTVGGRRVELKEKPPLLKLHSARDIEEYDPKYARLAGDYQPDPQSLKKLKARGEAVRVRTFFGTWCSACQRYLPLLLKVEHALSGSAIRFEYYGLPRSFGNEPEAKKMKITGVPTGVVFVGGREVGRLSGNDWYKPEAALDQILSGNQGSR